MPHLGGAETVEQFHTERAHPAIMQFRRQRLTGARRQAHTGQILGRRIRVRQQQSFGRILVEAT